jgi:hypothetical protein
MRNHKEWIVAGLLSLALIFGGSKLQAAQDIVRSRHFGANLITTNGSAHPLVAVSVVPSTIYLLDFVVVAKETAGANKGLGYGKKCYCVVQVLADATVQALSTECEGFSGLSVGADPSCTDSSGDIVVNVTGNADETINWLGDFTVHTNSAPNAS